MENGQKTEGLIHPLDPKSEKPSEITRQKSLIILVTVVILGMVTGLILSRIYTPQTQSNQAKQQENKWQKDNQVPQTAGVDDKKLFNDSVEGVLEKGGIEGEGEYHLERPGGESQNVYLTSTTIDLSQYVGKKVRVRGKTYNAQVAGWLMEVGFLEVIN